MAKLVINPTSASKKEIPIVARVISIGRDPSNDLVLQDSMVSRRHAILEQRDDGYVLRDNGSSNGTLVNGDRVDAEKTLRDGDLVAIGSSRLLFRLDDSAELAGLPVGNAALGSDGFALPGPERRCPACGKAALAADRFCRACGVGLDEGAAKATCISCGADVLLPADFCGTCGKALHAHDLATRPHQRDDLLRDVRGGSDGAGERERPHADPPASPGRRPPRPARVGPVAGAARENGGFGQRLVAALVDWMILGIPLVLVALVWATASMGSQAEESSRTGSSAVDPLAAGTLALVALAFLYFFGFWAFRGATPGGSLVGLEVRLESGETPIGPARAMLRALAAFVGLLPLGLGFLWVALSSERVALHDRISRTRVTRVV